MSQEINFRKKCTQCNGTGVFDPGHGGETSSPIPCNWPGCVDGYIQQGKSVHDPGNDDIMDKCNDILDKCNDILDKLDE